MDAALVTAKPETLDQLMTQIEQQHASMPKRLREIGNFVLGHPEAIALSTLAELAAETDIATSAFVRFAQTLGFDGFSQMQALFRQQVRSSWPQYASRLSDMADVDPADHFEALSVSAVESINRLSNTVSMEHLDAAVQKLTDAETIWFAAGGRSKPVAVYMNYVLTKLGIRSQEFREAPAEAMRELNLIKIISITDTMVSPVALDTTLLVTEENIFGFRSLCATMNLAQYLAIETGLKREKDVRNA